MDFTQFRFILVADEATIRERRRTTGQSLFRPEPAMHETEDESLVAYLETIAAGPGVPATQRDDAAGISRKKGSRFRQELLGRGLVTEISVATGQRGENFKDFRPTAAGHRLLENRRETEGKSQKTGWPHQ